MSTTTVYLKDYLPSEYSIERVELDFDLNPTVTTVTSTLNVIKNPKAETNTKQLVLNGEQLELQAISINGKPLATTEYTLGSDTLTISNLPDEFQLQIITKIKPQDNTALSGLYRSNTMYCTQCEAEGFRRITYYLDRPDVMSKFIVTIHADKKEYPVLLANGNLIAQGDDSDTRHYATWVDPFLKPCYLFAMVAGDLIAVEDNFVTMSGRLVKLKLFVERENLEQTAHAMAALKKAMAWDEQAYGREYDLDIYMIVAVNDFNMGAMENKGLNIFNSKYVLVSPATATDIDYEGVDLVIGHEYFHNWSGNRVTCRDWFQLSLKEGFTVFREQQFTQDITQSPVARIDKAKTLMLRQFAEDAGPLAHPVRPDSYIEINNFYTMTIYEKGAEVIRMMLNLLGPEKFRAGTDLYFSRFDGQAVTTDDFVAALQDASGVDLSQFKLWYTQAGTPEVEVIEDYDANTSTYTLTLSQYIPDTPGQTNKQPMLIPIAIGLLDDNGNDMPIDTPVLSLSQAKQSFVFDKLVAKPRLSILRNFSAPVKLKHDDTIEYLAFMLAKDSDTYNRWYCGQRLYMKILLELTKDAQIGKELKLPEFIYDIFVNILLDSALNLDLKAELLSLPPVQMLIDNMLPADPDSIYKAKKFMVTSLATRFEKELLQMYREYTLFGPYRYTPEDAAHRTCKNTILTYLLSNKTSTSIALAVEQYNKANNMTDTIAALAGLANIESNERIVTLIEFYDTWATNTLVINKWLMIQATADLDGVLDQVKALMRHNAFDIKNPNKVQALIGGFCVGNPVRFHDLSGAGYKFLADVVLELNGINPQVAARMLTPLTQWQRFGEQRQKLMCGELRRIQQSASLSTDVSEIVNKSLSQHE
jgi:aminopeptidase N